jgi:hypothetical protein
MLIMSPITFDNASVKFLWLTTSFMLPRLQLNWSVYETFVASSMLMFILAIQICCCRYQKYMFEKFIPGTRSTLFLVSLFEQSEYFQLLPGFVMGLALSLTRHAYFNNEVYLVIPH